MSKNANSSRCRSKNPSHCAYHGDKAQKNILDKDINAYLLKREQAEQEVSASFLLPSNFDKAIKKIQSLDKIWHGAEVGQAMYDAEDTNWAQIEWIGWGFEFWAKNNLGEVFDIHSNVLPEHKTLLDAHNVFPWDFKTHVKFNARGKENKLTPLNDKKAIDDALEKYGKIGFIVAEGEATFGDVFEAWRLKTKGKMSKVQERNRSEGRRSRKRKDTFEVTCVNVYVITKEDMVTMKEQKIMTPFKQGRQADGSERKEKYNFAADKVKPTLKIAI